MHKLLAATLLAILSLAIATGCRTSTPIYNVQEATIVTSSDKAANVDDVKKAIIRAGASLGWNMKEESVGHIIGTLHLRTHMAQVDIKYGAQSYSISYRDSQNLNYDGTNIHGNYNGWIQRLQQNIQVQMNTL